MRKEKRTLLDKIADLLMSTEDVQQKDNTNSGEAYVLFVLTDGNEIYVDQDGFATMNEEQMSEGEHKLADGNLLMIDKEGRFAETKQTTDKDTQTLHKRTRLQEFEPKTAQAVKAKIAEMQGIINDLTQTLNDAQAMVEDTITYLEEKK